MTFIPTPTLSNELSLSTRGDLETVDPFLADLIRRETEQQARKLILIASISSTPPAVLQALGSVFQNACAEGYPSLRMTRAPEAVLQDLPDQLAYHRRYADRRFYKGMDYVNLVESLAQRRCAELFAHEGLRPEDIQVNVQPLSGATANLAVYHALMRPGDVLMGMGLHEGGHLTHGSKFNASGKMYQVVSYTVDPKTGQLDYEAIRRLAKQHRPRVLVAGFTSYPWAPDWQKFRDIADEVGAYLLADIAHPAGLVAGGVFPNPVGIAHVSTFTPNKTMCGPRSAVIMTTDENLGRAMNQAVFPGEQGAPHPNKFAAMAVAFGIAGTDAFKAFQRQVVANAKALADGFLKRDLRLAYGGTNTHLLVVDLKSVKSPTGVPLWGETAARILDLAGIVVNKNSIMGDTVTALSTGIRLGTVWMTQSGLVEKDMDTVAGLITNMLTNIHPFYYDRPSGLLPRGKISLEVLEEARETVAKLNENSLIYGAAPITASAVADATPTAIRVAGIRARQFMQQVCIADLAELTPGRTAYTYLFNGQGALIDSVMVLREPTDAHGRDAFLVLPSPANLEKVLAWFQGLSDGYILFDAADVFRKVDGPVTLELVDDEHSLRRFEAAPAPLQASKNGAVPGSQASDLYAAHPEAFSLTKPYVVGQAAVQPTALPVAKAPWQFSEAESPLKRTALFEQHKAASAKMSPFAGWEMPLWYSSVGDEHKAVREAAGLFDVMHMGVFEMEGPHATSFLDVVFSNHVGGLEVGQSAYGYLLGCDGEVIDDAIVYRRQHELYLMVVNAANEARDWDWLQSVNERKVMIDASRPWVEIEAPVILRNLKDAQCGKSQRGDVALQGPASLPVLQALADDARLKNELGQLRRNHLLEGTLAGMPVIIARTGYTGETWGFEIFVHPDDAARLWMEILKTGAPLGVKPIGLAARDSLRTEAGLPLWGHELAGEFNVSPLEAGFSGFVKFHKPFYVGREAMLKHSSQRQREVVRFQVNAKGKRRPQTGDPVIDARGQVVGQVTSCALGSDQRLVGLAIVNKNSSAPQTSLSVLPLGGAPTSVSLVSDGRVVMPVEVTVVSRFPETPSITPAAAH